MFMFKRTSLTLMLLTLCLLGLPSHAQQRKLAVGDNAPGLDIETWISGEETTIRNGTAYLIYFMDTSSPPSRRALQIMNEAYKQFEDAGLTVIAVTWEEADVARRFVNSLKERVDIAIAVDRREGTKRAWIDAANITVVPTVFIVDRKSKVAWLGNPASAADLEQFVNVLSRVIDGRYDPRLERQAAPGIQGAANARKVQNWRMANKYYDDVITLDANVFAAVALDKFEMLLVDMGDREQAYAFANELISEKFASDSGALLMLADKIALDPKIESSKRDLDVALLAAESAMALVGENHPKTLASVARIRHARGELAMAIDLQKKAYFIASPRAKPEFKRQLEIYQKQADREASIKRPGS